MTTMLEGAAEVLEAVHAFFDDVETGGVAKADGAIIAEGGTGDDGDICLAEEAVCEVLRGEGEAGDVREDVEGAERLDGGDLRYACEAVEHVVAAEVELVSHIGDGLLIATEGGEGAIL